MIDDATLVALCIWDEAAGEMYEGKVAVGRVIRNRMAAKYESDGTVAGTVLAYDQFSGFYFAGQPYVRIESTPTGAAQQAAKMLVQAQRQPIWPQCQKAWVDSASDSEFVGGPQYEKIDAKTLLYCNTAISHPAWATQAKQVCVIGHHTFFHL